MKVWRLIAGILSIVFSPFVLLQSGAAGLANTIGGSTEVSGSIGVFVALLLLAGGIASIVLRNKMTKGANIALIVIFIIPALFGFVGAGRFTDLKIWAGWCLLSALLACFSFLIKSEAKSNQKQD